MAARPRQAHGRGSKIYGPVLLAIWRRGYVPGSSAPIAFTLDDVRKQLVASGLVAATPPDVVYRMRGRTQLPQEMLNAGYCMITNTDRGKYAFIAGTSTLIDYPEVTSVIEVDDHTPVEVRRMLYTRLVDCDEQSLLSVIRYNDMFSRFTGFRAYHLKAHARQSVVGVGQAEVDDVHVSVENGYDGPLTIIPVEAKAKHDPVVRTQVASLIHYARHAFPTHPIRPMTVKMMETGEVLFMEFNVTTEPNDLTIVKHAFYRLVHGR